MVMMCAFIPEFVCTVHYFSDSFSRLTQLSIAQRGAHCVLLMCHLVISVSASIDVTHHVYVLMRYRNTSMCLFYCYS